MLKKNSKDIEFWRQKAELNYHLKNYEKAIIAFENILILDGKLSQESYTKLFVSYFKMGIFKKASEFAKKANLDDESIAKIVKFLVNTGNVDVSKSFLNQLKKDTAIFWELQGILQKATKENSESSFEKAYSLNPANAYVCYELASVYLAKGKYELAKNFFERAKKYDEVLAEVGLGNVEIARGNYQGASLIFKEIYEKTGKKEYLDFSNKLEHLK